MSFSNGTIQKEQQNSESGDKNILLEEIANLKKVISQKDQALNQWMRMCEDLSQNLLQKQIDIKQMEISQNLDQADYSLNESLQETSMDLKDGKREHNFQSLFYQNENYKKFTHLNSTANDDKQNDTSRYNGVESTAIGSFQTLNVNGKDQNGSNQQHSPSKESKKVECSIDSKQLDKSFQFTTSTKKGQGQSTNNIDDQYIKEIEQVENEAINLLNEFKKQIGLDIKGSDQLQDKQIQHDDEKDILSESIKLRKCVEDLKEEKETLTQQNNQFFRIINEKCLEIQHLQGLLIQREQNVIDYSEKRNEEYRQFLMANNSLVHENKEQREMIFRFQQQLALLNYLKAENQEVNILKLEKQNLQVESEKQKKEIRNLKIIIQEQSEFKLQYNELKADYDILANQIQSLGDEYISNSAYDNTCPTCFSKDQYRLIISQLQQKYLHLEKQYKHDTINLMENINVLKLALEKQKDQ